MTCLLLSETALRRLQPRLEPFSDRLVCVAMDRSGELGPRADLSPADAPPQCGYLSGDLFADGLTDKFVNALLASAALDWVQSAGAGVDHAMFKALAEKGIRLTTNHSQAIGIAEYVLWGVLNHFQGGRLRAADQAAKRWAASLSREVAGTRWLIIGFGAIGEAIACLVRAFGAHVTGIRRNASTSPWADEITTPDRLGDFLGISDIVVLCAPRTPQTANMVDADFLAGMKSGSVLVNVARGGLVDENSLLAALDAGKPEHALLDVFNYEPLPKNSRLWRHPRVTLTPHSSALSAGLQSRTDEVFLRNLALYLANEPLLNEVREFGLSAVKKR